MKKVPAIPDKQGQPDTTNHQVIGKVGGIEEFAHTHVRQPIHKRQTRLQTENAPFQPDEKWIQEPGDQPVVQRGGLTVKAGV